MRRALVAAVVAVSIGLPACSGSNEPRTSSTPKHVAPPCDLSKPTTVSDKLVPSCGAWWGAYTPTGNSDRGDGDLALLRLEGKAGRRLGIVHRFHDMSTGPSGTFPDTDDVAAAAGRLLYIGWASRTYTGTEYTWRQIADGKLDATVIDPAARRVAAYGRPLFLDFDHEPDAHLTDGKDANFVAAYRHIHGRFAALGAKNVVWVWTVTGFPTVWHRYPGLYPGDDVVDWVAWDPYNFYECHRAPWKWFSETVTPFYRWLVDHHPDKPYMLGEYGTVADPDDRQAAARWYDDVVPVLETLPRIKAAVLFDEQPDAGKRCDTRLRPAPVFDAWARAGRQPYVNPPVP